MSAAAVSAAARVSRPPILPHRYRPIERAGVGGIGEVWRVEDANLGRDLAVKLLRRDRRTPEHAARLAREALLTGRLQHPGVPPVVERGTCGDGGPFFAMKLVGGQTLRDLLKEASGGRQPPERPADEETPAAPGVDDAASPQGLPRLLTIFRQVCDAVGYAHGRGVIHRDLKPANVMVGDHGEVQVMDWGMARLVRGELENAPDESAFQRSSAATGPAGGAGAGDRTPGAASESTVTPGSGPTPANPLATMTAAGVSLGTPAYMPPEQARGETAAIGARSDVFGLGAILCTILTGKAPFASGDGPSSYQKAAAADLGDAFARLDACGADDELKALCRRCLSAAPPARPADGAAVAEAIRAYEAGVRDRLRRAELDAAAALVRADEERKRRRVWAGLATAAVLCVLAVGTAAWGWQQRRLTDRLRAESARGEIAGLLEQAAALRDEYRFDAAETLLAGAADRLPIIADGSASGAVRRAGRDLEIVRELDRIRLMKATRAGDEFDTDFAGGPDGAYAAAFRTYGIDVVADDAASVGRRIAACPVAASLVAAIDDWTYHERDDALEARLLLVAQAAEPSPARAALLAGDDAAFRRIAAEVDPAKLRPATAALLADRLDSRGEDAAAAAGLLKAASAAHPADFWLHFDTAHLLARLPADHAEEAAGRYRAALAGRPGNAATHNNLGVLLERLDRPGEAEAAYRTAIRLAPGYVYAHANLGTLLTRLERPADAEGPLREAIRLDAALRGTHAHLGLVLAELDRLDEAEEAFREAVRIDPGHSVAQHNLSALLAARGRVDEAEAAYRAAAAADSGAAGSWHALGVLLAKQGRTDDAVEAYRAAVAADPTRAASANNLGNLLKAQGRLEAAAVAYRAAVKAEPNLTPPRYNLGDTLFGLGRLDEAEAAYRDSIRLGPDHAESYCNLSLLLKTKGRFREAVDMLRRGHELGSQQPGWPYPSAAWLEDAEALADLADRFDAVAAGKADMRDVADAFALAEFALVRRSLPLAAARLYAAGLDDPETPGEAKAAARYDAACAAVRCAEGFQDAAELPADQRDAWRAKARDWLRADLTRRRAMFDANRGSDGRPPPPAAEAIAGQLRHWRTDPDLAPVRGEALATLRPDERLAWERMWGEHAAALRAVGGPAVAPKPDAAAGDAGG